jgi:hypothetical protein
MSYSLKAHVAECYRRAEEFKQLYERASNFDEREIYFSTRWQFLLFAMNLEKRQKEVRSRAR